MFTWVFPVTFMILMARGCESHTRELGRRALSFYGSEAETPEDAIEVAQHVEDEGHSVRAMTRGALLFLSVALPIGFVALVDSVLKNTSIGWLGSVGALVALSPVIAVSVVARHE